MKYRDFYTEVQLGNIAGYSITHKFGRNPNVANGVWEVVSLLGSSGIFQLSSSPVRIKAGGNAADTAAGAGARAITIIGIGETLLESTETIVTSGTGASLPTTNNFWRVYRAYVSDNSAGTYMLTNTGDIVIECSDGSDDIIKIAAGEGQSQHGEYSIPNDKTGYLLSVHLTVDSIKPADFRLFVHGNLNNASPPVDPRRLKLYWDGILGHVEGYVPKSPGLLLPSLTDIWIEAKGAGNSTEVSVNFEILLVDNSQEFIKTT